MALLPEDFVCDWPASCERFEGRDTFVAVQRDYPAGWSIEMLDVAPWPGGAASRVRVFLAPGVFEAVSFFRFDGTMPQSVVEYWIPWGADERPAWRAHLATAIQPPLRAGT